MTTRRRSKGGIRQFAEQVSRNFRWIDRTLQDFVDSLSYVGSRVAAIEEHLGIVPPPPPETRRQRREREGERLRWLMTDAERLGIKKTSAPSGDGGADSTPPMGKPAATHIRDGLRESPEGNPMFDTNDTAGGARDDS